MGGLELLLLGFLGRRWPWLWLLLLSLPLFAWFMHRQGRSLQSTIIVFLDQLAKDLNLSKLQRDSTPQPPAGQPVSGNPAPQVSPGPAPAPAPRAVQP